MVQVEALQTNLKRLTNFLVYTKNYLIRHNPIKEALDSIVENIKESLNSWDSNRERTNTQDESDERMFAVCCSYEITPRITQYLNDHMKSIREDISAINFYQYLKISSQEKLAEMLRLQLATNFIYLDDPCAAAYAIRLAINGDYR